MAVSIVPAFAQTGTNEISVNDIGSKIKVIGLLGKPLGEKVEITGTAPNQPLMVANPIKVISIGGKKPDREIVMEVRDGPQIEKDFSYTMIGYESGAFGSSPAWTVPIGGPSPQQPFQFYKFFIPVKVIGKKKI